MERWRERCSAKESTVYEVLNNSHAYAMMRTVAGAILTMKVCIATRLCRSVSYGNVDCGSLRSTGPIPNLIDFAHTQAPTALPRPNEALLHHTNT